MYMPNAYITHDPYNSKTDVTIVNFTIAAIVVMVTSTPVYFLSILTVLG